jgi:hypothetical protein
MAEERILKEELSQSSYKLITMYEVVDIDVEAKPIAENNSNETKSETPTTVESTKTPLNPTTEQKVIDLKNRYNTCRRMTSKMN